MAFIAGRGWHGVVSRSLRWSKLWRQSRKDWRVRGDLILTYLEFGGRTYASPSEPHPIRTRLLEGKNRIGLRTGARRTDVRGPLQKVKFCVFLKSRARVRFFSSMRGDLAQAQSWLSPSQHVST
jgi:hypothetical protein